MSTTLYVVSFLSAFLAGAGILCIHHLICELMNDPAPHDPRLIFIACSYMLTHRGHFLNDADKERISDVLDISRVFSELFDWFKDNEIMFPLPETCNFNKKQNRRCREYRTYIHHKS